jgi:SAM-dependent methyltransferase
MANPATFDELLAEANNEPVEGWDFSWLNGRATEERPSWRYQESLTARINTAKSVLDVQTGGGECFAGALSRVDNLPKELAATESWPPNLAIARSNLQSFGVTVEAIADEQNFPFADNSFDLVSSRHPTRNNWSEIERVLTVGGTYFSQQVGVGTNSELTNFFMGPHPLSQLQKVEKATAAATDAGLEVLSVREESLPVAFFDIGAVVYFLRKVIWTVPDFSTDKYRDQLKMLNDLIERQGAFQSHSQRYLIEARKTA